jgi:hypothetical protein
VKLFVLRHRAITPRIQGIFLWSDQCPAIMDGPFATIALVPGPLRAPSGDVRPYMYQVSNGTSPKREETPIRGQGAHKVQRCLRHLAVGATHLFVPGAWPGLWPEPSAPWCPV